MSKHQCTTSIDLEDEDDVEVLVYYTYSGGTGPQPYGDYPHPGDPVEIEIIQIIRLDDDTELVVSGAIEQQLYEHINENETPVEDDAADRADYLYDQMKDDEAERHFFPGDD